MAHTIFIYRKPIEVRKSIYSVNKDEYDEGTVSVKMELLIANSNQTSDPTDLL